MWKIIVLVLVFVVSAQQAPILVSVKEKNPNDSVSGGYPEVVWRATISDVQGAVIKRRSEKDTLIDTLLGTNNLFTDYEILPNVEYLYSVATLTSNGQSSFSNEIAFTTSNIDFEAQFEKIKFEKKTYPKLQYVIKNIPNRSIGFEVSRYSLQDGEIIVVDTIYCNNDNNIDSLVKTGGTTYSLYFQLASTQMKPLCSYSFTFTAVYDTLKKFLGKHNEYYMGDYQDVYEVIDLTAFKVAENITKVSDFALNLEYEVIEFGDLGALVDIRYEHFRWGNYLFVREFDSSLTVVDISNEKSPRVLSILKSEFAKRSNYYLFGDKIYSMGNLTDDSLYEYLPVVSARFNGIDFEDLDTITLVDTLSKYVQLEMPVLGKLHSPLSPGNSNFTVINDSLIAKITPVSTFQKDIDYGPFPYSDKLFEVKIIGALDGKMCWSSTAFAPQTWEAYTRRYYKIDALNGVMVLSESDRWASNNTLFDYSVREFGIDLQSSPVKGTILGASNKEHVFIRDSIIIPRSCTDLFDESHGLPKFLSIYMNSDEKLFYAVFGNRLSIYRFTLNDSSPVLISAKGQQGINRVFINQNRVLLTNFKEGEYLVEGIQPSGRVCFSKRIHSTNSGVDLTQMAKGPIFIKVSDFEGSVVSVGKFVVK